MEPAIQSWAVGVTTAPRQESTLQETLTSLIAAGWESPWLFAEAGTEIPSEFANCPTTIRASPLSGAFPNWYLALAELVLRLPAADAYFICQDDVLFASGLRDYLEQTLWPEPQVGLVSVYCPSHYAKGLSDGYHPENRGWQSWGALAYIFPPQSARELLQHPRVLAHRREGPRDGLKNIDSVVGRWCQDAGRTYYVHVPSLTQHIGATSTLWPKATAAGRRRADRFLSHVGMPGSAGNQFSAGSPRHETAPRKLRMRRVQQSSPEAAGSSLAEAQVIQATATNHQLRYRHKWERSSRNGPAR